VSSWNSCTRQWAATNVQANGQSGKIARIRCCGKLAIDDRNAPQATEFPQRLENKGAEKFQDPPALPIHHRLM
jgi:hypothetical protein